MFIASRIESLSSKLTKTGEYDARQGVWHCMRQDYLSTVALWLFSSFQFVGVRSDTVLRSLPDTNCGLHASNCGVFKTL
jgi:hypothetical protein